ncbi:MAG: ABC transporter permease subunit [Chloroflexota bacterium]
MNHIFWFTLRRNWLSLAIFGLGIGLFHWLVVVSFPAIGGLDAVQNVVQTFPPGLRSLLRIAPNLQAGFGLVEYLSLTWFHPVFLGLGSAFVVQRATDAIAGEIESGAIYLTLSRPILRRSVLLGKALEMFFGAGILCFFGWLGLFIGAQMLPELAMAESLPFGRYGLVAMVAWLLFMALGAAVLVISSLCNRKSVAGGIGSIWAIGAFLLDVVPFVAKSSVGWLNPWHHYFPQEIMAMGTVEMGSLILLAGWIVGGVVVAVIIFGRRDLV